MKYGTRLEVPTKDLEKITKLYGDEIYIYALGYDSRELSTTVLLDDVNNPQAKEISTALKLQYGGS